MKFNKSNKKPNNIKRKCNIPVEVLKLLSQKPNTKLSFIELRKLIIDYITTNNLYDNDDKT